MISYFLSRGLMVLPTLFGVSLVCFFWVHLTPGGPVEQLLAEWRHGSFLSTITDQQKQQLVHYYGFDQPLLFRYCHWMGKLLRLDFGESFAYAQPVSQVLWRFLPVSVLFGGMSFFLTYLISIPLGVFKVIQRDSWFDKVSSFLLFFFYSIPSFALGILLIVILGGVFPIQGLISENYTQMKGLEKFWDVSHHIFLPLVCYTVGGIASLTILLKNSIRDQLLLDYILTARAKGMSDSRVITHHAFRIAVLPLISGLGYWIPYFFSGTLLIETVFGLNGLGRLSYDSIVRRDYPVVLAIILMMSFLNILGNFLSDILYTIMDPRIDFS